jgi:hypothetical protein
MFSMKEKQWLSSEIEKLLLKLDHPEMPKEKPEFFLSVYGKESWSHASIKPNWHFSDKEPGVNPWNEVSRDVMKEGDHDVR